MASGTRRVSTGALAAGATSPNLLADDTLRYPGQPSGLTVAATTALAGAGVETLEESTQKVMALLERRGIID